MKTFAELNHKEQEIPNYNASTHVLVLDNGALIGAEAEAMLQALYSRSPAGIKEHLKVVAERGAEKFMATYYVGYGHQSIGDCSNTTVFLEGVSILSAKAFQDWPLYSGQECSTRYIDFGTQPFLNPAGTPAGAEIQERWRAFYVESLPVVIAALKLRFPRGEKESETVHHKAIAARAFDILRGFLPAGATTSLAWRMNLRQAADQLRLLRHHPLAEVRGQAEALELTLREAYPSSFGHKRYEKNELYHAQCAAQTYHFDMQCPALDITFDGIDREELLRHREVLSARPPKSELPRIISNAGIVRFDMQIDYGSYRDLQRHRAVQQCMPLLTEQIGFESWYMDELPQSVATNARRLLSEQSQRIAALGLSGEMAQYYIPMGYRISHRLSGNLSALAYLVELRATSVVHPTLAVRAEKMAELLRARYGECGLVLHIASDPGRFDVKRGTHDIVKVA